MEEGSTRLLTRAEGIALTPPEPEAFPRPIRVLHVFLDLPIGGAQLIFLNALRAMDPTRCRIMIACLAEPGVLGSEVAEVAPLYYQNRFGSNDVGALLYLYRLIRAAQVDVVHTYLYSRSSVYGRLAAILARVPVVIADEMGRVGRYPWKRRVAERLLARFTDHFVTPSQATRAELMRLDRLPPSRVTVVYPGVDAKQFVVEEEPATVRRSLGLPDQGAVIGVLARLDPIKRHADLIAAFPHILQVAPATQLLFIGDGPAAPELHRLVQETGVAGQAHFLGARRDIPWILRALDLLVLPSQQEGLPNSILEAMAAGVPVVATWVGGIPEVVIDGETGLLVPPRDPMALAKAVNSLLTNPEVRQRMGAQGRARVKVYFTNQRTAAELDALYRRLLQAKGIPGYVSSANLS